MEPSSPCWLTLGISCPWHFPLELQGKGSKPAPGADLERPGIPPALQVTQWEKDSSGCALIFLVRHWGPERGNDLPGTTLQVGDRLETEAPCLGQLPRPRLGDSVVLLEAGVPSCPTLEPPSGWNLRAQPWPTRSQRQHPPKSSAHLFTHSHSHSTSAY